MGSLSTRLLVALALWQLRQEASLNVAMHISPTCMPIPITCHKTIGGTVSPLAIDETRHWAYL